MRRPLAPAPAAAPFSSITGVPAKSGSVVASMITASVMVGSAESRLMVCGPAPAMLKWMRSGPVPFALPFAARIASRSEMKPSLPRFISSASIDEVSPSAMSLAVVTTTVWSATGSIVTSKVLSVVFTPSDTLSVIVTGPP